MDGTREVVRSADGTTIGLLTAGAGPPLLLVHGGLAGLTRWAPLWKHLVPQFRVSALDRRGRGSSGDAADGGYDVTREYDDVRAVAEHLAAASGAPVDVLGHSFGGICALGAAGRGAPLRRLVLYEPPGPSTVNAGWLARLRASLAAGRPGPAVASFLLEVIGLTHDEVGALREQSLRAEPGGDDVLTVASRTLVREADALAALDLAALAGGVRRPVLFLRGTLSPPWAADVIGTLRAVLPDAEEVVLDGAGHEGVDTAAGQVAEELVRFLEPL